MKSECVGMGKKKQEIKQGEEIKYPIKSKSYKGVYQRKNGTWFYRAKRIVEGKEVYYQRGGFANEQAAYDSMITRLRIELFAHANVHNRKYPEKIISFGEAFDLFLTTCKSESSKKKYHALYTAQMTEWNSRPLYSIEDGDIEALILKLKLQHKSESYIASIRKVLKLFFKFAHTLDSRVSVETGQFLSTKTEPLKVMTLFSGIGAPEQALKELKEEIGLDYKLVGYCEWDDKASYAYSLLHNVDLAYDYCDVENLDFESCKQSVPDFDLLIFGSPCQDFSSQGKRKGFFDPEHKRECLERRAKQEAKEKGIKYKKGQITEEIKIPELYDFSDLYYDRVDADILSRSGLIYRAVQVILWKKPKFVVVENVSSLMGKKFKEGFDSIITIIQRAGYNVYYHKFNSLEFNVPQNRSRLFMVFIRDDLKLSYIFPEPLISIQEAKDGITLTDGDECEKALDWFFKEVADEYYFSISDAAKLKKEIAEGKSYVPNLRENYISCITTTIGQDDTRIRRTIVKDEKGLRRLSSEELMKFQGFPPEYGTLLRNNGYTEEEVGSLVGNSITVPVIKAILKSIVDCISDPLPLGMETVPKQLVEAKIDEEFIEPIFAYAGNKTKLLKYLRYQFPSKSWLKYGLTFVDLFAGSAFMAINTPAERVIINEIDPFLVGIYKGLSATPPQTAWDRIMLIVKKYDIGLQCKPDYSCWTGYQKEVHGSMDPKIIKDVYKPCEACKEKYRRCKAAYNRIPYEERVNKYWYWGVALVYAGYNRSHVSHNMKMEFNTSHGSTKVYFDLMKKRFFPFARALYDGKYEIYCQSYKYFPIEKRPFAKKFFFYVDPPYFTGTASYNKDWSEQDEKELYSYLDALTSEGAMWMLSNALENKGERNQILADWLKMHPEYHVYYMKRTYTVNKDRQHRSIEIMVVNYSLDHFH